MSIHCSSFYIGLCLSTINTQNCNRNNSSY